jgi:hypothetical protein
MPHLVAGRKPASQPFLASQPSTLLVSNESDSKITGCQWLMLVCISSEEIFLDSESKGRYSITSNGDRNLDFSDFHDSGPRFSMHDYKKPISDDLGEFIGYEDMALSKTNR